MDSFDDVEDLDVINMIVLDDDTRLKVALNMEQYGGSFVKALGACLLRADIINRGKLAETFINYVRKYAPDKWKK